MASVCQHLLVMNDTAAAEALGSGRKTEAFGTAVPKTDGRSGYGVVIKGVDRDTWITFSKIAVPLRMCTAMGRGSGRCLCSHCYNGSGAEEKSQDGGH